MPQSPPSARRRGRGPSGRARSETKDRNARRRSTARRGAGRRLSAASRVWRATRRRVRGPRAGRDHRLADRRGMDCPQLAVAKLSDLAVNVGADPAGLAHRVENPPYGFDVGVFAPDEQQHVAANGRIDRTGDRRGNGAPCSRPRPSRSASRRRSASLSPGRPPGSCSGGQGNSGSHRW